MPRTAEASHHYWENTVKRAWEALRRYEEFRQDCKRVGATSLSKEEAEVCMTRFHEKWGVACNDPDLAYKEVKAQVLSLRQVWTPLVGKVMACRAYSDIPFCFVNLEGRLKGYSGGTDQVVRCREIEEMFERIRNHVSESEVGPTLDNQKAALNEWCPPDKIHFTVDINTDPFTVQERVLLDLVQMRNIRVRHGYSKCLSERTLQRLQHLDHPYSRTPKEATHMDFAKDDERFRVWDLKRQGKKDMEIAQIVWLAEYKSGKGRDTTTGDKGPLAQRVHDHYQKAEQWIEEYPKWVRHAMVVL